MKLAILHLSDIHLKSNNNSIMSKKESILAAIQNYVLEVDSLYGVITGDVAYSGLESEYYVAIELIDFIKDHIKAYSNKLADIIAIPGNHDCDYTIKNTKTREMLINQLQQSRDDIIDSSISDLCCEVQAKFFDFSELYLNKENIYHTDRLLTILRYTHSDYRIQINCFNTSWLSQLHEQYGRLHFPINMYKDQLDLEADLTISLLHHPFNW
jgi:predicted MPP superfamily phosphohydrolase